MKFLRKHVLSYKDYTKDGEDAIAQKLKTEEGTAVYDPLEGIE